MMTQLSSLALAETAALFLSMMDAKRAQETARKVANAGLA